MTNEKKNISEAWGLLEAGRDYNRQIGLYENVDRNERFFRGDQWNGVNSGGLPTPVFNLFKRVIGYYVSSIMQSKIALKIDGESTGAIMKKDMKEGLTSISTLLTSYLNYRLEKDKIMSLLYEGIKDCALQGDMFMYVFWDKNKKTLQDYKGDFSTKLIDNTNVFFGDVNVSDVQSQPYILISGRELVSSLKREAIENGLSPKEAEKIVPDSDVNFEAGDEGKNELKNTKCTYVIKFFKENGNVWYEKCTRNTTVVPRTNTKLTLYPIVMMNWEKTKNSYHGTAASNGLIENQVYINKAFAMVMKHMINVSFSKVIYDQNVIDEWTNEIGEAIAVNGSVENVVSTIAPGTMQPGFLDVINLTMGLTRELMGVTDAALGNVDATNTSAILALQESSAIPLQIQKRSLYTAVEDLGLIWLDYILHYYDRYRLLIYRDNGEIKGETVDMDKWRDAVFLCSVSAGMSSYVSEISTVSTLENLLKGGYITTTQYLERLPDGYIDKKEALIEQIRENETQKEVTP